MQRKFFGKFIALFLVGAGAWFAAACAGSSSAPRSADDRGPSNPEVALASTLVGNWQGVTPGNELRLDIDNVMLRSLSHPHDLFLRVTGRFENTNVAQSGYMHLQSQGNDVFVGFIPHFDATVTSLSRDAGRFSSSEANAACSFYLTPRGDGFAGDTRGSTSCALAMRGAIGKWAIEVEPGTLAVRHVDSGETLRFRKVSR